MVLKLFKAFRSMAPLPRFLNTRGPLLRVLCQKSSDQKKVITLKLSLISLIFSRNSSANHKKVITLKPSLTLKISSQKEIKVQNKDSARVLPVKTPWSF